MIKQCIPLLAICVILSACASIQMQPAQTASVEKPDYAADTDSDTITDRDVAYATVSHVYWFFGDR